MASLEDVPVVDAVAHAYNLAPSNYRVYEAAEQVAEGFASGMVAKEPAPYRRTEASLLRDWAIEETANVLFRESPTDFAIFHAQSITLFEDGLTALEKAERFVAEYPTRAASLAGVDLIGMDDPVAELERQVAAFDPHGVKVYPSYWEADGTDHSFLMDDPERAFPLWEAARDLGLDVIAVHKAIPFGDVPIEPYSIGDVEDAAAAFPDLNFEVVHGGSRFARETGWLLAAYPNVYVNLELTNFEAVADPEAFARTIEDLCWAGGPAVLDQLVWGTGAPHYHPRLLLETFWEFDFPELSWRNGTYTVGEPEKRKILAENVAACHRLDLEALLEQGTGDAFDRAPRVEEPWSSTDFEVVAA